ncbi:hypothetical protein BR93DRAFT_949852 [Coniochaeta sp. PMI_546]|nr:hypothetical protein BR93DRAFT_949852 [Coniochaeta sp. PMI_546]
MFRQQVILAATLLCSQLLLPVEVLTELAALNPKCRPGANFDLTKWQLQLPIPDSRGNVLQVPPSQLSPSSNPCANGYQDPNRAYFFTESGDGAMVMKAPGNPDLTGCTKFAESSHCRTEFGEVNPSSWKTSNAVNRLTVTLLAVAGGNTCIGQVFQAAPNPNKPLCELYYWGNGSLFLAVAQAAKGGNQKLFNVGYAAFGTKFTYELSYEKSQLGFALNGGKRQILPTYFSTPNAFFKAGNYNQDRTATTASIHVFAIDVVHGVTAAGLDDTEALDDDL